MKPVPKVTTLSAVMAALGGDEIHVCIAADDKPRVLRGPKGEPLFDSGMEFGSRWRVGVWAFFACGWIHVVAGGPFKPGFGLSGQLRAPHSIPF